MRSCSTAVPFFSLLCAVALGPLVARAYVAAEDEAHFEPYNDGWQSGDSGGRGFAEWKLFAPEYASAEDGEERYAGFFIAGVEAEGDLSGAAREGKAFGIFANGTGFEETVASRAFTVLPEPGDVFSFRFEFDGFERKFERDAESVSSVGLALRSEPGAGSLAELTTGRMFVFAALQGLSTYQILDAEPRHNTRIFIDPAGVEVSVRFKVNARYDLEIRTLSDDRIHRLENRRLLTDEAASAGLGDGRVRSFALFNLNGGRNNAYFNAFQLARETNQSP